MKELIKILKIISNSNYRNFPSVNLEKVLIGHIYAGDHCKKDCELIVFMYTY